MITPLNYKIETDNPKDIYILSYFHGGIASYVHGAREDFALGTGWQPPKLDIASAKTSEYVPLILFMRQEQPKDAFMVQMDYIADWAFHAVRNPMRQNPDIFSFNFDIDNKAEHDFKAGSELETPTITLAVYSKDDDELMKELYDWQYNYMWDYTNRDYFAKTRSISLWVYCTRNLHEQFAYRMAVTGMYSINCIKTGFDMIWDDAGWSACDGWPSRGYDSVFFNNYEGPDFSYNQKFMQKCGLKWLLWFAGKPSPQLMEHKSGAWGNFEWRTDAVYLNSIDEERNFRNTVQSYLDADSDRSFHTCSGGSTYSHSFDIARWSNYNYLADAGRGPVGTYNFSYFEYPDKWGDILPFLGELGFTSDYGTIIPDADVVQDTRNVRYMPEFAREGLAAVPYPGTTFCEEDEPKVRIDLSIYSYFLKKGIAGRFCYVFHPHVEGDKEYNYLQRTSQDRLRACIILKLRPRGLVKIYPNGLIEDENYSVCFMNSSKREVRTGSDLKNNGIILSDVIDGELIFFNLDDHPASTEQSRDAYRKPLELKAYKRSEMNVGVSGVAVYWSKINEISRYEIICDGKIIGTVNHSTFYFDIGGSINNEYIVVACLNDGGYDKATATTIGGGTPRHVPQGTCELKSQLSVSQSIKS